MPALARRVARAPTAATMGMTAKARELRDAGHQVVQLTLGEPDFAAGLRCRKLTIEGDKGVAYADGDPMTKLPVTVQAVPAAGRFIIPAP